MIKTHLCPSTKPRITGVRRESFINFKYQQWKELSDQPQTLAVTALSIHWIKWWVSLRVGLDKTHTIILFPLEQNSNYVHKYSLQVWAAWNAEIYPVFWQTDILWHLMWLIPESWICSINSSHENLERIITNYIAL